MDPPEAPPISMRSALAAVQSGETGSRQALSALSSSIPTPPGSSSLGSSSSPAAPANVSTVGMNIPPQIGAERKFSTVTPVSQFPDSASQIGAGKRSSIESQLGTQWMMSDEGRELNASEGGRASLINDITMCMASLLEQFSQQFRRQIQVDTENMREKVYHGRQQHKDLVDLLTKILNDHEKNHHHSKAHLKEHMLGIEQRLSSLERYEADTNSFIRKLPPVLEGLDAQVKAMQMDVKNVCTAEDLKRICSDDINALAKEVSESRNQLNVVVKTAVDPIHSRLAEGHKGLYGEMQACNKRLDVLLNSTDQSCIKGWLDDHSRLLKVHLDVHSEKIETISAQLQGMPDHESLLEQIHGLSARLLSDQSKQMMSANTALLNDVNDVIGEHLGDHSGRISSAIDKLPMPLNEKSLLQAIERIQETSLDATLKAMEELSVQSDISCVKQWLDDHGDKMEESLKAHSERLVPLIEELPVLEEANSTKVLEAIQNIQMNVRVGAVSPSEANPIKKSSGYDSAENPRSQAQFARSSPVPASTFLEKARSASTGNLGKDSKDVKDVSFFRQRVRARQSETA